MGSCVGPALAGHASIGDMVRLLLASTSRRTFLAPGGAAICPV
ncbi:MAG: hypothetical protein AAGH87_05835 [Pseudomonadota bacterium]